MEVLNDFEKGLRKLIPIIDFEKESYVYRGNQECGGYAEDYTGIYGDYTVTIQFVCSPRWCNLVVNKGGEEVLEISGSFAEEMRTLVDNKIMLEDQAKKLKIMAEFLKVLEDV